ncbi:MAG TPA: RraA family protein [Sphingomonadaceae bacterium]|nr:RraA family protein [Sphingomonadaceae bacterium]
MGSDKNVARAAALETATISDALDRLNIVGQCAGIQGRDPDFRMAGRAFTMRCGPASKPPGTVGDYIDDVPEGAVVVIDNGGRTDATIWGDILTEIAHRRKLGGTLIDGINRDVHLCRSLGYPVFSRGHWMRTGKDRVQVEEMACAVDIGGARVAPGDIVRGDPDGVVVIPAAHEEEVLAAAEEIHAAEEAIRATARTGVRLDEARRRYNYHNLQTRRVE